MQIFVMLIIVTSLLWPVVGNSQSEEPLEAIFIAKSTFVYLAEPASKNILQEFAYLPAGTKFLAFKTMIDYQGSKRRIILTEGGIWAYIRDGDDYYWNPQKIDSFLNKEKAAVVRQKYSTSTKLSEDITLTIALTPSEIYRVVNTTDQGIVIAIDNKKLPQLSPSVILEVTVPFENAALWSRTDKLLLKDIRSFTESIFNNVRGIRKDCDTNQVRTITFGGGVGIDLSKYFSFLKINAEAEMKTVQEFGAKINVSRRYYSRKGIEGVYSITKKQSCEGSQELIYIYNNPDNLEIAFNADIATKHGLARDGVTGQMLVTCTDQYFKIEKFLLDRSYNIDEIPFIISKVARFKQFNAGTCLNN